MNTNILNGATSTSPMAATAGAGANSSGSTGTAGAGSGIAGLTMNNFLSLMTAQLKNQDPLNPTDSNQFLSQLSALSTVQGISQMNSTMTTLSNSLLSSQALTSTSLVGHKVLTSASSASYAGAGALDGAVQVPAGANSVVLAISDASGAVISHIALSPASGLQGFSWNGGTDSGRAAPGGNYTLSATVSVGGKNEAAPTLLNGTVQSVTLGTGGAGVILNTPELGPIALSSVQTIS